MAKKEEIKCIINTTPITFDHFITYRNFAGLLMTKRGMNRFFSLLIVLFSLFLFYPLTLEIINSAQENRIHEVFLYALGFLPVIFASALNIYSSFTFNKRTMIARRTGLFVTCICLSLFFLLRDTDAFIMVLAIGLPLSSLFGLVYPFISNKKEYLKVQDLAYHFEFFEDQFTIVTNKNKDENKMRSDYKFAACFEMSSIYFLFISPTSALFVSKSGFSSPSDIETFVNYLQAHEVKITKVNW